MSKTLLMVGGILTGLAVHASLSYQGVLKNGDGTLITGLTQGVEVRLYTDATTGDSCVWGAKAQVALAAGTGIFNLEIADTLEKLSNEDRPHLDDVLAAHAGQELYLGLTVNGSNGEIRPRQKLFSVPTAAFAQNVRRAANGFTVRQGTLRVQGEAKVHGDLTASALAMSQQRVSQPLPVPVGGIIMWTRNTPPGNEEWATDSNDCHWAVCNGQSFSKLGIQTPNLVERFVVGVNDGTTGAEGSRSPYSVHDVGGTNSVVLSIQEMPKHGHEKIFLRGEAVGKGGDELRWADNMHPEGDASQRSGEHRTVLDERNNTKPVTTGNAGGAPHENRPPFTSLIYIMRVR